MQVKEIVTITTSNLPSGLSHLQQPPKLLHVLGNNALLYKNPTVGIVGARKFTPYGQEVTVHITTALARAGVTIISGLALGVDSIVHQACIDAGGQTIAVLPSGIGKIYPASHYHLAQQIVQKNGLLVSENPLDYRPQKFDFLKRNRIIAGLSDILIITEAGTASGSLNTARNALELGITIFAVPGPITSPYSSGTNRLIQSGAIPLLDPQEVLDMLGVQSDEKINYIPESKDEAVILELLNHGQLHTNELISRSGLDTAKVQADLTMMEIKGVISISGGQWRIN